MRRFLLALLLTLFFVAPAYAQLGSVPFVFVSGNVISSSEVNQNFSTAFSNALNRTGGTMTGTLNVRDVLPVTDNTYNLGNSSFSFANGTFDGTLTTSLAVVTSTGASSLDIGGGLNAGTGNVAVLGTDGRIVAIDSTRFASLSGANLTGIPEAALNDDSLLARLGSSDNISGTWTLNNNVSFQSRNNASAVVNLATITSSNELILGPTSAQALAGVGVGTSINSSGAINFATGSTLNIHTVLSSAGVLTHGNQFALSASISPSDLASGNNNNYAPSGVGGTVTILATPNASNSVITGVTAQPGGTVLIVCDDGGSAGSLTITDQDTNSTAANRFDLGGTAVSSIRLRRAVTPTDVPGPCATFIYSTTISRWLWIGAGGVAG